MSTVLRGVGGWLVADTPGGVEALRTLVDPSLHALLDGLTPSSAEVSGFVVRSCGISEEEASIRFVGTRLRWPDGRLAGTVLINKPAVSMTTIGTITAAGDLRQFELMQRVSSAARRPAAILFADLEGSSPLARRLSTASYFGLGRRLVRAADRCVIDAGGLIGRHFGDGVVAFFLAETTGSEAAAATACISVARELRAAVAGVAQRSGLAGGRALASKALVERLEADDAAALGLDPEHITYTALSDLSTATEKARRDAPAIAVCEV